MLSDSDLARLRRIARDRGLPLATAAYQLLARALRRSR